MKLIIPKYDSGGLINLSEDITSDGSNPNTIKIFDPRKKSPTTGKHINNSGYFEVSKPLIKSIIEQSKARGIDPKVSLATGYQETRLGDSDGNIGHNLERPSQWFLDNIGRLDRNEGDNTNYDAAVLVDGIKQKFDYAHQLGKKNLIDSLQVYNGLGKLYPSTEYKYQKGNTSSWYGVPTTKDNPIDLKKNPLYGKTVKSLIDSVIGINPQIQELIKNTPAWQVPKKKDGGQIRTSTSGRQFIYPSIEQRKQQIIKNIQDKMKQNQ